MSTVFCTSAFCLALCHLQISLCCVPTVCLMCHDTRWRRRDETVWEVEQLQVCLRCRSASDYVSLRTFTVWTDIHTILTPPLTATSHSTPPHLTHEFTPPLPSPSHPTHQLTMETTVNEATPKSHDLLTMPARDTSNL